MGDKEELGSVYEVKGNITIVTEELSVKTKKSKYFKRLIRATEYLEEIQKVGEEEFDLGIPTITPNGNVGMTLTYTKENELGLSHILYSLSEHKVIV